MISVVSSVTFRFECFTEKEAFLTFRMDLLFSTKDFEIAFVLQPSSLRTVAYCPIMNPDIVIKSSIGASSF